MKLIELLQELERQDIKLRLDNKKLKVDSPKGALTPLLKAELVKYKTKVAAILERNQAVSPEPLIVAGSHNGTIPASKMQCGLWMIFQSDPSSIPAYNIPWSFKLQGSLNRQALNEAFNRLIDRHESLRTTFREAEGQVTQVVAPRIELDIPVINVHGADVQDLINRHAAHRFDLESGPLLKVTLLRKSSREHFLLINIHHLVSDGWSMDVLTHELSVLYNSYPNEEYEVLKPLSIQYADYVRWQTECEHSISHQEGLDFWEDQLKNSPALLEFPTDRQRFPRRRYLGDMESIDIDKVLTEKLHELCSQEKVTLFMVLMAAFQVLLFRYSGQKHICVGTPVSNRSTEQLDNMIGLLLNVQVFHSHFSEGSTFREVLNRVKSIAIEARKHQLVRFEDLVAKFRPGKEVNRSPLFQVMFVLQSSGMNNLELDGVVASPIGRNTYKSKYDLNLDLREVGGRIEGALEYDTDLFDKVSVRNIVTNFKNLLQGIVANCNEQVSRLPLLDEATRRRILYEYNNTAVAYPNDRCIHQIFEDKANKHPNKLALVYDEEELTYGELNSRSQELAYYLKSLGVGADSRVGVCLKRSTEMLVSILGVLKAGGAYVPLDPNYPEQRIHYILSDSAISLVLTDSSIGAQLDGLFNSLTVIKLDTDWQYIEGFSDKSNATNEQVSPQNLAYIIYTSGSTGNPKGVMINHESAINTLRFLESKYPVENNQSYLLKTNFAFDVSVSELFGWFMGKGHLVILPDGKEKETEEIISCVSKHNVTHLNFVPSVLISFVQDITDYPEFLESCSLKYIMVAGEAFPKALVKDTVELFPSAAVENIYGPTETSVYCSYYPCSSNEINCTNTPIGKPIDNMQLYVLDTNLQPVPIGVTGELFISGTGLARGYLNQEELTNEKFIENPFVVNARMYRSGDLARWLNTGDIEYLGRCDHQVKIRGFRIELGEIENKLLESGCVSGCSVVVSGGDLETKRLVAYIVPERDNKEPGQPNRSTVAAGDLSESSRRKLLQQLRDYLLMFVPEYMVPAQFVILPELPLTASGKVDRKALPDSNGIVERLSKYTAPRNELERKLVVIWSEILDISESAIGVEDSFLNLGGHSLQIGKLANQIRERFGVDIKFSSLYEADTIASLAALVGRSTKDRELSDYLISSIPDDGVLFREDFRL